MRVLGLGVSGEGPRFRCVGWGLVRAKCKYNIFVVYKSRFMNFSSNYNLAVFWYYNYFNPHLIIYAGDRFSG